MLAALLTGGGILALWLAGVIFSPDPTPASNPDLRNPDLAVTTPASAGRSVGIEQGNLAPDFEFSSFDGRRLRLSSFRGQTVFLNFWATWCGPCRTEMPDMEKLLRSLGPDGLVVIGVNTGEAYGPARRFLDELGVELTAFAYDSESAIARRYGVYGMPTSYFIDREGIITRVSIGQMSYRVMEAAAHEALAGEPGLRKQPLPPSTRLMFTGDIIPARCVYARQAALGDYTAAFRDVGDVLRAADITIGSLDGAISDVGEPIGCLETFSLLAPARSVEGLVHAGFDVISVATNHAKDCGRSGGCGDLSFNQTLANLREASVAPAGGGRNLEEARRPVVVERHGVRFAFLAYDDIASAAYGAGVDRPGTAPLHADYLREDIEAARRIADVVIVLPHWGVEYTALPTQRQRDLAAVAIEAGATLVVGNHPHVVQAIEPREGSYIAYALGNFVFDQDWSLETQQGLVLEATFAGARLSNVRLIPVRIRDMFRPTWADADEAASILRRVRDATP